MKKITLNALLACAVCFASACENKRESDENTNYSTTTEKMGSGEGDELGLGTEDSADVGMQHTTDSTKITTGTPGTPVYTSDADFVAMAASGGLMEVEAGKAASQKGSSAEVKKFGQQMVTDHSKANAELKSLAAKKKWTVPTKMNAEHQANFDRISNMSGAAFDKAYAEQMVTDHEKTVALFEQATQKATDADLKSWASKTLPTLRMHLDMARDLNNKMKNAK